MKSTRLIEASYRLTLVEQQIIFYAIVEARDEQRGLTSSDPVTIRAMELAAQFGTEMGSIYGQLKEAMDTLFKRYVVIYDIHPDTGEPRVTETRWLSTASYIDK